MFFFVSGAQCAYNLATSIAKELGMRFRCAAFLALLTTAASAQAQTPPRAGEIRALIPTAFVVRSGAPQREARKQDVVQWQDILRTDRGGRVRVALDDGSILNVGSESQLQIVQHDPRLQRTSLQLAYGRIRANVARIAQPGGSFEVRTPVAVAGVVGTRFFVKGAPDGICTVLALEEKVRVRNADAGVAGEVILNPGEFTTVARGVAPATPAPAPPDLMREAEDELNLPVETAALTRIEASWPPAACGQGTTILVRAWKKQVVDGKESEAPVPPEMISGRLMLGADVVAVEDGRAVLPAGPSRAIPKATFAMQGTSAPAAAKIWEPVEIEEKAGEGWRAPRAQFVGSAFAVQGPMLQGVASFTFAAMPAQLLWQGSCGAGFLAPVTIGREYDVTLSLGGAAVARGKMNLISVSYRIPQPPVVLRGQPTTFGIDLLGLENLQAHTAGRPVLITTVMNTTPTIIGNLRSAAPGARSAGETLIFTVGGAVPPGGVVRLDGIGTGRMQGAFALDVNHVLDAELRLPRNPLTPAKNP